VSRKNNALVLRPFDLLEAWVDHRIRARLVRNILGYVKADHMSRGSLDCGRTVSSDWKTGSLLHAIFRPRRVCLGSRHIAAVSPWDKLAALLIVGGQEGDIPGQMADEKFEGNGSDIAVGPRRDPQALSNHEAHNSVSRAVPTRYGTYDCLSIVVVKIE
jgi:hypothetical protein